MRAVLGWLLSVAHGTANVCGAVLLATFSVAGVAVGIAAAGCTAGALRAVHAASAVAGVAAGAVVAVAGASTAAALRAAQVVSAVVDVSRATLVEPLARLPAVTRLTSLAGVCVATALRVVGAASIVAGVAGTLSIALVVAPLTRAARVPFDTAGAFYAWLGRPAPAVAQPAGPSSIPAHTLSPGLAGPRVVEKLRQGRVVLGEASDPLRSRSRRESKPPAHSTRPRAACAVLAVAAVILLASGTLSIPRVLQWASSFQTYSVGHSPAVTPRTSWRYDFERLARVDLSEQVVLVTGANAGIDYATALNLARQGAHVILACRSPEKCSAAAVAIALNVTGSEGTHGAGSEWTRGAVGARISIMTLDTGAHTLYLMITSSSAVFNRSGSESFMPNTQQRNRGAGVVAENAFILLIGIQAFIYIHFVTNRTSSTPATRTDV